MKRHRTTRLHNQKNKAVRSEHETINGHLDRHRAALVRVVSRLQMAGVAIDNATIKNYLDLDLNKAAPKRATVEGVTPAVLLRNDDDLLLTI